MKSKSKIAAYIRVSTFDQAKGSTSQAHAIKRYCESHGLKGVKYFTDVMSGGTLKRVNFEKMQQGIFLGEINTVLIWKLDRISRSLKDGINTLTDWLDRDIRIIAIAQQLDFSGPTGKLIASVLFALAEMERENLRENTKRGLAAAKARGVKLGGRKPGEWTLEVHKLHAAGMSPSAIAKELGRSRQGVWNVLSGKTATFKPE